MDILRRIRLTAALLLLGLCGLTASARDPMMLSPPQAQESRYRLAPFGTISVYRPLGEPRGVVLLLSGDSGWDVTTVRMARAISGQGLIVAGVSTPALMKALEASKVRCINPNYPLVALARDVQHRLAVRTYMRPIVIGYSAGATVAYAGLAQWPNAGWSGVISMGFSADLPGVKHWCAGPGFAARPNTRPGKSWLFAPSNRIKLPWVVMQGQQDKVVDLAATRRFAAAVLGARFIELPQVGHDFTVHSRWLPQMRGVIDGMLPARGAAGTALVSDMPLTLIPTTVRSRSDIMAVIYSGDGGWVGIDQGIAQHLAAAGIPVVGVDSLSYFWSPRTPEGTAADLSRVISAFSSRWHRPRVMLIGYSFGADTLPFTVGRLDPATRSRIVSLTLLGLSATADFQFHLSSWLDIPSSQAMQTVPAIMELRGLVIKCVRGKTEKGSACPAIPRGISQNYVVPGNHHFNRNTLLLTRIILSRRVHPTKSLPL